MAFKGKLFEQIYKRKCDYSMSDCKRMAYLQATINIMIQDLLQVSPEAAKALAEAKEAAKAAIDAAIEADDNEAVTAVAEEAKAAIKEFEK